MTLTACLDRIMSRMENSVSIGFNKLPKQLIGFAPFDIY